MKKQTKLQFDRQYDDEADLLADVKNWIAPQHRDGVKLIPIRDRYARGYSDLFICVRGIFVVAELKDKTGTASPHQLEFIDDIIACGGIGAVCRTVGEVAALVEQAKEMSYGRRLKYADKETLRPGLSSAT